MPRTASTWIRTRAKFFSLYILEGFFSLFTKQIFSNSEKFTLLLFKFQSYFGFEQISAVWDMHPFSSSLVFPTLLSALPLTSAQGAQPFAGAAPVPPKRRSDISEDVATTQKHTPCLVSSPEGADVWDEQYIVILVPCMLVLLTKEKLHAKENFAFFVAYTFFTCRRTYI